MPRRTRQYFAGFPSHVIQRGNNRSACFHVAGDRHRYLEWLGEASLKYDCAIHAYVLMSNHAHLLVTPAGDGGISRMMQSLGRRFVRYFNFRYNRTGTLWEGRHKASLIDAERYFLICSRYIELNPVRAGMVADPAMYRWSSFQVNALGAANDLISPHPLYMGLAASAPDRVAAYRELFKQRLEESEIETIRYAAKLGIPIGAALAQDDHEE